MISREVLIIEDDSDFRESIKFKLGRQNYTFSDASSAEQAVNELSANLNIRVILLDLSLPGGSGKEFLEQIRNRASSYRVIILTAHEEILDAKRAKYFGVFTYLPKVTLSSFSVESLRFTVDQAFKDIERELLSRKIGGLLAIQKKINLNRSLHEILGLICESALQLVGGYTCHVRLYDDRKGDFALAAFRGPSMNMKSVFEKPKRIGDFFSGIVAKTKRPEWFDDLQGNANFMKFKDKFLASERVREDTREYLDTVQSAYIVPISTGIFGDAIDAVLNISSTSKAFFSEESRKLIDEFVIQMALAITKDWLQTKRIEVHQDYSRISRMLGEVSDKLRGLDVLDDVYDVVTKRISELINPEIVSVFLFNEETGKIENVAELRGNEKMTGFQEEYEPGQSLTGSVFARGETIRLPNPKMGIHIKPTEDERYDLANKEMYLKNIPSGELEHYLGVPIKMGETTRGVLRAINKTSEYYERAKLESNTACLLDRGFSEDCQNVLEITASHLAVAIRNAELINKLNRQVKQLETLSAVGQLISSEIRIDRLLELTIEQTADVMHAEICMLFLKNEAGDKIILKESYGMPRIEGASYAIGEGVTGRVALDGKSCLIGEAGRNDGKYDQSILEFLREKHRARRSVESLMVVPIVAKGNILGAIKVINKLEDHFQYNEGDLRFFETFASYVGVAIENAQVYDLTDQRLTVAKRNVTLSQLVRSVAHEINNTSGLIPANVQAIKAALSGSRCDESINEMLDVIEDSAMQAVDFANEIAGFSSGRMGDRRVIDINSVIKRAINQIKPDLKKCKNSQNIALKPSLSSDPIPCYIYVTPFIQITRNIVINAYQAMERTPKGLLEITSSKDSTRDVAVVEFTDNGCGITKADINRIFEPDFSTKPKGNGLGLWLTKDHLERIDGFIRVQSKPRNGAKFSIEIPLRMPPEGELTDE